jgi:peptidoglycan/xylan/chitin deacetylase (PgdA/CDA1 family)
MTRPPVAITVDVEGVIESNDFHSVHLLDSVLETLGEPVTLFVTPAVVREKTETVADWVDGPHDVGLHVHPSRLGGDSDWLAAYDAPAIQSFLERGRSVFEDRLEFTPTLFRAGRWSFSPAVLEGLNAVEFTADASHRPAGRHEPYNYLNVTEYPMTVVGNEVSRYLLRSKGVDGVPLHADAFLRTRAGAGVLYPVTALVLTTNRPYVMVSLHDYDLVDETTRRRIVGYLSRISTVCQTERITTLSQGTMRPGERDLPVEVGPQ